MESWPVDIQSAPRSGMYRLEARVRCESVTPYANDRNGGLSTPCQRRDARPTLIGTRGWSALAIPLQ